MLTGLRRAALTIAAAAVLLGPVAGFLGHPSLPLPLRAAWIAVALATAVAPVPSFLVFLALGVLLPVVPSLVGWPDVSLIEMWALALLVPAWIRAAWRHDPVRPASSPWAGVLAVMATASAIVAISPLTIAHGGALALAQQAFGYLRDDYLNGSSQRHVLASVGSWAVAVEGLAIFWLARRVVAETGRAPVLTALSGASVVVAVIGLWQWWTGAHLLAFWREYDPFLRRINSTFTDVNALGAFLAMLLPAVLWRAGTAASTAARLSWGAGALALVVANVFTASRVAWGGMVLGVLTLAWLLSQRGVVAISPARRIHVRRAAWASVATLIALVLALGAWGTVRDVRVVAQRSYLDPVLATLNMRAPLAERLKGRLAFWDAGAAMIAERPLGGIGIGRFFKEVSRYASDPASLPRQQENAHNYFLQLAAELGLPTLVVLLAIWAAALRRARSDVSDERCHAAERWAAAAAVAGIAAFAVTCLTGHSLLLREGQFTTWTMVAVALGAPGIASRAQPRRARSLPWIVAAIVVLSVMPRTRAAIAAVDLTRVFEGLHEEETWDDGRIYRWTEREAVFHVPASAITVSFTLRTLAPAAQFIDVSIGGRDVDRLRLDDHNWHAVRYVLPPRRAEGYLPVRLRISPTWRAPGDARDLGVMLSGVAWTVPPTP